MRVRNFAAGATAAMLISACGSAQDASTGNFQRVIDAHYSGNGCIQVRPDGGLGVSVDGFPATIELDEVKRPNQAGRNERKLVQFEGLVSAGLLSVEDTVVESTRGMWGDRTQKRQAKVYSLTDVGRQYYQESGADSPIHRKSFGFCVGQYRVDEIKRFSEPGTMGPYTMSEVAYVYSPRDVPDWANDARLQEAMPTLAERLKAKQDGKATLIKTNEGWVHERDFSE